MDNFEKPRISRLTAILTQLQSKRIVTAREIANKHHVSIRTIYRDIKTLENSGIPIFTEQGKGYSLIQGFNLPPVMFTEQEANALITAEKLIISNTDESLKKHFKEAITKLKAILRTNDKDKINFLSDKIKYFNNSINTITSNNLDLIQSAITNFNKIKINYHSISKDELTERIIEPLAIYNTKNQWILIANCHLRNDYREFRLDKIKKSTLLEEQFKDQKFNFQTYFQTKLEIINNP